eukprot:scaffold10723_cov164-Amphora_coffeaeformis.AAC.2
MNEIIWKRKASKQASKHENDALSLSSQTAFVRFRGRPCGVTFAILRMDRKALVLLWLYCCGCLLPPCVAVEDREVVPATSPPPLFVGRARCRFFRGRNPFFVPNVDVIHPHHDDVQYVSK